MAQSSATKEQNPRHALQLSNAQEHISTGAGHSYGDILLGGHASAVIGNVYINGKTPNNYEAGKFQELLRLLPSLNFGSKHDTVIDQCTPGTGQWFLDSTKFRDWCTGQGQVLWCPGIPGAGKTCMAAIATEYLRKQKDEQSIISAKESIELSVNSIYFDYGNKDQQNPRAIFGDLLGQILRGQPSMPKALFHKCEEIGKARFKFNEHHYLTLLSIAVKSYQRVFIVLDALDECTEKGRKVIISGLQRLGSTSAFLSPQGRLAPSNNYLNLNPGWTSRLWIMIWPRTYEKKSWMTLIYHTSPKMTLNWRKRL